MRHREETLEWVYKLGWVTPYQLARMIRPAAKILPHRREGGSEPRLLQKPTTWSKTTGWKALEDLRSHDFAYRERAEDPRHPSTTNGGRGYAYALTPKKGIRAGAIAAGEDVSDAESLRKSRGKYMRSMIDESRIAHRLHANEWFAMVAAEAPGRRVEVQDCWAEGGSVLKSGSKTRVEADGRLDLVGHARDQEFRWNVYVESDTGTQRQEAIMKKAAAYGDYVIGASDYGRDPSCSGAELPLIMFFSRTESRSTRVRDYILGELKQPKYEPTRQALARASPAVRLDDLFLVSCLEWCVLASKEGPEAGALGESCAPVGSWRFAKLLNSPHIG